MMGVFLPKRPAITKTGFFCNSSLFDETEQKTVLKNLPK